MSKQCCWSTELCEALRKQDVTETRDSDYVNAEYLNINRLTTAFHFQITIITVPACHSVNCIVRTYMHIRPPYRIMKWN